MNELDDAQDEYLGRLHARVAALMHVAARMLLEHYDEPEARALLGELGGVGFAAALDDEPGDDLTAIN